MQLDDKLILQKRELTLSALQAADRAALVRLAQDPRTWQHNPSFTDPADFLEKWFFKALAQKQQGKRFPFVIRYQNIVIGSSSFYDINAAQKTVSIGYTWLHPDYWGKGINGIVKKLLLDYAFEQGIKEVHFVIDMENLRSRAAVLKLGAKEKEIFRDHIKRADGTMRDSIVYMISRNLNKALSHSSPNKRHATFPQAPFASQLVVPIKHYNRATPYIATAGEILPTAFAELANRHGFKTIVDVRTAGEGTGVAREAVQAAGMKYINVPVDNRGIQAEHLEIFAQAMRDPELPMLIYCASGNRVGALWATYLMTKGVPQEEGIQAGQTAGMR